MSYTHIFFDLDGTLVDSKLGITNSVSYALRQFGIDPPPREALLPFIGPPLLYSFAHMFGMNEEESERAVAAYRVYYQKEGMLQCTPYEGIRELLAALRAAGKVLVLATCKPTVYATRILEHFGFLEYFTMVSGPELDGTRNEKDEVIAYALEQLGITDHTQVVMIGDRKNDADGAACHGIDCFGVLWGFGSAEELTAAGAIKLYQNAAELCQALLTSK